MVLCSHGCKDFALTRLIIAIIIFAVCLSVKVAIDLRTHYSGKQVNHKAGALVVCIALLTLSFWVGYKSAPMWFFGWWVIFDLCWNVFVGNPLLYVGETAYLDKLQRKYPVLQVARYLLFIGSIIFFIYA